MKYNFLVKISNTRKMSEGEYDMEWDDDAGGDGDGWGDDGDNNANDGASDGAVEIENNFYEAEGDLKDKP